MTRCSYCDAEVPAGAKLCPNCGANLGPASATRFGSPAADGWIGGLGGFFVPLAIIGLGFALSQSGSPWWLIGSFILALGGGITGLVLSWKKYPSLRLGLLIGLGLALLNPFTLCLGFIGVVTMAGPG
ncbi:MAG: zinc ribbon domain-containing protein [Armatimonas sp.]